MPCQVQKGAEYQIKICKLLDLNNLIFSPDYFIAQHRRTIAQVALLVYVLIPLVVTAQVIIHAGEGKLYNNGSVVFASTAQGDVDNLADSFITRTDPPNQGQLAGSYKLNPSVYNMGKDTVVVEEKRINYSDVVNRAFFQSAGQTGVSHRVICRPLGGMRQGQGGSHRHDATMASAVETGAFGQFLKGDHKL